MKDATLTGFEQRDRAWATIDTGLFDVLIVGGGVNGSCLFDRLSRAGYRVLLSDAGDFSSGTSQASAMMVWGGLAYLRNASLATVYRLCGARDEMVREMGDCVRPCRFRYLPTDGDARSEACIRVALYLYWLLGLCRRSRPRAENEFPEKEFLSSAGRNRSLAYEEAVVAPSDVRLVLRWILGRRHAEQVAINYCRFEGGGYDRAERSWHLELTDTLRHRECGARARLVVNAAGPWTDAINERLCLHSPYHHVLSKGVFIALQRHPRHCSPLIIESRGERDCLSLIPWGPVSLWGPTETVVEKADEGFRVLPQDVRWLLDELNRHLRKSAGPEDVISLRCGVRPLAVRRGAKLNRSSLPLSRRARVHVNGELPWISVYGGKLTGSVALASSVCLMIRQFLPPSLPADSDSPRVKPPKARFPGIDEEVSAPAWCAEQEMCHTLEDYLRRRTNIAQWVARCGLGVQDEYAPDLLKLAEFFPEGKDAECVVAAYRQRVRRDFDEVLASC